jgi:simple sugar transport system permease protein
MKLLRIIKKAGRKHEFYLFVVILLFTAVMTCINRQFLSLGTLFDVLNSSSMLGMLAIGTLIVMISGGIDISFSAIAAISMYVTVSILNAYGGNTLEAFAIACLVGGALGLINAFIIAYFNISTMIVTLATSNIFYGLLLQLVPHAHITSIPAFLADFGKARLFTIGSSEGGSVGLSAISATMLLITVLVALFLKFTSAGRNVFAIGGSKEAARRESISVWKTQILVYCLAGVLAGGASILNVTMIRYVNPFDVYGVTMDVIAAVVLGGARLSGGSGSVPGTILGVVLLFLIKNNLVLMGIPSVWDSVIVGTIIIVSITLTVTRAKKIR